MKWHLTAGRVFWPPAFTLGWCCRLPLLWWLETFVNVFMGDVHICLVVALSCRWNRTSCCMYLWRATLTFCFARLDRETPNTGSQVTWPLWLPSFGSILLSETDCSSSGNQTTTQHSRWSLGTLLPQFLKKYLSSSQTRNTFSRKDCQLGFNFQLFSDTEEMQRELRAAACKSDLRTSVQEDSLWQKLHLVGFTTQPPLSGEWGERKN